jgi:hypothetical protein
METEFITPPAAAKLLGVSIEKIINCIRRGELKAFNLSDSARPRWKIARSDLQSFLDRRSNQAARQEPPKKKRPLPVPSKEWV